MSYLHEFFLKVKSKKIKLDFLYNKSYFYDKIGLEIGGPSSIFQAGHFIPIYPLASRVDGVNFSTQTVWEDTISTGMTYRYQPDKVGFQHILEASHLQGISDQSYDFLLSSHSLEHCANTLKTLNEWLRVLKKGGVLVVVVPDRRFTFDHKRNVTSFQHLMSDFEQNVGEEDLTHLSEILDLHDITRDAGVVDYDNFVVRSNQNYHNRCLHHHVFDLPLLKRIFKHLGIQTVFTNFQFPFHQVIVGRKP